MKLRALPVFLGVAASFVLEAWGPPCIVRAEEAPEAGDRYAYFYRDRAIPMRPSDRFLALEEAGDSFREFVATHRLRRHPLSDRAVLRKRNLGLYQIPSFGIRGRARGFDALRPQVEAYAEKAAALIQPVFEQGEMILIPSDRVIAGFDTSVTAGEAARLLHPSLSALGITDIVPHRRNTVLVSIRRPANGMTFEVSRALSGIPEVAFAEPDLLVVRTDADLLDSLRGEGPVPRREELVADEGVSVFAPEEPPMAISALTRPTWMPIAALDCESPAFPPAGWTVGAYDPDNNYMAAWGRTDYRSHGGSYSIYCAGFGLSDPGVAPPGPAPTHMDGFLRTPVYDLTGYEEVYVEVWFYAINDLDPDPGGSLYDAAVVRVADASTFDEAYQLLAVKAAGDMTADPTTDGGWRRLLYRVPPAYRVDDAYFEFGYKSDEVFQYEGAYLDDILILGTPDVDTEPLGMDPYAGRQYELQNVGQIADLGNGLNDMDLPEAWSVVSVSPSVVLAVVDEGVDLSHPDLNLVAGYDWDGTGNGAARGSHGTACAGNAGAIGENGIGVAGTAPGVKIMPVYFGDSLSGFASAIDTAVANGADILSNSWGIETPFTDIENAVTDALSAGKIVVFAAGNGPDREPWNYDVRFPCNLTGSMDLICVGASSPTDEHKSASSSDGNFWWGSSYVGPGPDVCAPGPWSYTTDRQGADGYNDGSQIDPTVSASADYTPTFGGTSSSTPKVAGIAALMLSANPCLTPGQVKTLLKITADDIGWPGNDDKTGAGRVNAHKAVLFSIEDCGNDPVKVASSYYGSVQSAYDGALEGDEIQLRAQDFAEPLDFDQEKGVLLTGGYDCYFTYPLLSSSITGALTVRGGTVTVRNLVLQ